MSLNIANVRDHLTDSTDSVRDAAKLLERVCKHHPAYTDLLKDTIVDLRASEKCLKQKLATFDAISKSSSSCQHFGAGQCQ